MFVASENQLVRIMLHDKNSWINSHCGAQMSTKLTAARFRTLDNGVVVKNELGKRKSLLSLSPSCLIRQLTEDAIRSGFLSIAALLS